ncbi:hypothetical protein ACOI1H_23675 [Loktanella sp. DJP18]|uniref:hypothetical protein n=1 Tax=Loktanella sp. DJP18 TaxID=3409788 RepID=UPI003BB69124
MSASVDADLTGLSVETLALRALAQSRIVLPVLRTIVIPMLHAPTRAQAIAAADSIARRDLFSAGFQADLRDVTQVLTEEMTSHLVVETMWSDHDGDVTGSTWTETIWTDEAIALAPICGELGRLRDLVDAVIDRRDLTRLLAGDPGPAGDTGPACR